MPFHEMTFRRANYPTYFVRTIQSLAVSSPMAKVTFVVGLCALLLLAAELRGMVYCF